MIRPVIGMLSATALGSALLASGAAADPWMLRGPAAGRGPAMEAGGLRPRGGEGPAAPLGQGEANASGPVRPTAPSLTDPAFLARRDLGVTRAVEARGGPILIRLAPRRMTQVHFPSDIQQVVTAFTKPQVSLETAGPRLFLSALDPDVSGELFVTLSTGGTLALVIVPAGPGERDLVVRVVSPVTEATARMAETAGLTPLRLMRAMILDVPLPGVSPAPGDGRVVYEDGALRLTLLRTWTSPALEGVVLAAENLRALWIRLPLDRLAFTGLLAVHAEAEQLAPPPITPEQALAARHRTRLYLVRVAEGR
jgi:TraK protein